MVGVVEPGGGDRGNGASTSKTVPRCSLVHPTTSRMNARITGEPRITTIGFFKKRMVVVTWTPRDGGRRVISMRKANDRERAYFGKRLGKG